MLLRKYKVELTIGAQPIYCVGIRLHRYVSIASAANIGLYKLFQVTSQNKTCFNFSIFYHYKGIISRRNSKFTSQEIPSMTVCVYLCIASTACRVLTHESIEHLSVLASSATGFADGWESTTIPSNKVFSTIRLIFEDRILAC